MSAADTLGSLLKYYSLSLSLSLSLFKLEYTHVGYGTPFHPHYAEDTYAIFSCLMLLWLVLCNKKLRRFYILILFKNELVDSTRAYSIIFSLNLEHFSRIQ